jgi:hypothetical protein
VTNPPFHVTGVGSQFYKASVAVTP